MLIDRGIADKDRIGIQGHSWSGYQVALGDSYKYVCLYQSGAAVSSMVSAYTGIRTGSGCLECSCMRKRKAVWVNLVGGQRNVSSSLAHFEGG
ncbi:MAG: alpha/beta hydrolase family protein [Butyricimonas paravirosa]